jgi:hypothetical protein
MKTIENATNGSTIISIEDVTLTEHPDNSGFSIDHTDMDCGRKLWILQKGSVEYSICSDGGCFGYDRNYTQDKNLTSAENYSRYAHCDCHVLVKIHDKWEIFTFHRGRVIHTS